MVNFFCLWLVYVDPDMYDPKTDTRAVARSTNVTDLGQVQYIFSDKTGTLTQNVMRFKRCSVDGMIFGAPVEKVRPQDGAVEASSLSAFHPVRQLVVGKISYNSDNNRVNASMGMTFNAEMLVRVMSLCHTVVVEKDLDNSVDIDESKSVSSSGSSWKLPGSAKKKKNRRGLTTNIDMSGASASVLETVSEEPSDSVPLDLSQRGTSKSSLASMVRSTGSGIISGGHLDKGRDGAPAGFAYQAESPDENALVSEASKTFGFQVVGRKSSEIVLRCEHPTILSDEKLVSGLKDGSINPQAPVSNCATGGVQVERSEAERLKYTNAVRTETWEILAVNKFDSDRKRMSILLRAPVELGSAVILFCKGADSSMLDPEICSGSRKLLSGNAADDAKKTRQLETMDENDDSEWDTAQMLGIQSHLGEFASEGLRTLVLGIRFLTDGECEDWLQQYRKAASSLKNRDGMLRDAASSIEKDLHIVGATAVEDKLQTRVPDTIATLGKAGIKLWVLTGDKKETAIEIGYSTKVLTPSMHLTEVADQGFDFVRAQCAMEFMRLVKAGKLPLYQKVATEETNHGWSLDDAFFAIGKGWRSIQQLFRLAYLTLVICLRRTVGLSPTLEEKAKISLKTQQRDEKERLKDIDRRRNVRKQAEQIIKKFEIKYPKSRNYHAVSPSSDIDNFDLSNDDLPTVFNRAESAKSVLNSRNSESGLTSSSLRNIRISQLTAQEVAENEGQDEDLLSLKSICLAASDTTSHFDRKKRTVLERLFAVDRDVRKGRLLKHVKKDKRDIRSSITPSGEGPRALIIEGNALKHLLGDAEMEELIFNIASQCESVIACRVSPQQKALLVKLVRHHVVPEPVTLAIGDGANDVGMIQESHVGIGISGKEGRQAVNASDFAISQFRFLESLVLIHGRWDFMRQATVVLFSFYKNAVMAGCLITFNGATLYSGQSLFDQWTISAFNFIVFFPIFFLGIFDRCLEKDYIRKHPVVYQSTRENEVLTVRVLFRWIFITVSHIAILYFGSLYYLSGGAGNTSSFSGLMRFHRRVGDGEGTDLKSIGLVVFSSLILMLAYKVLYESRTIINGHWPPWWKFNKEGFFSRVPYTWYGIFQGSIFFHFFFFLPIYQVSASRVKICVEGDNMITATGDCS
jgi:magnesium-transporting ATPase (P-type)